MEHQVWDALAVCAAQMLSGLMGAWAAHYHGSGARELVAQIDRFCDWSDPPNFYSRTRKCLDDLAALREHAATADIVDALIALGEERQRRRKERKQQRVASEQGPIGEVDVGWDF
jgi:hypothetical protein